MKNNPKEKDIIIEQNITQTLEKNYMPYAMSVIISRAIPEIDGFKPSHRKILYTMYKMGLLTGARTKSANVVGQTMKLNPHGDMAIYETMVRLSEGNEALIHAFVDSKGNFGKQYSRDMAFAASRYTEVKLSAICNEVFRNIDKDTVDFIPNYDNSTTEPLLLPTTFPNILVNPNQGIAVGMANSICSFNLSEICTTTIELIKNPEHDITSTLVAPDFSTGAQLIFNPDEMASIYKTGRGSFKLRSKYIFDKKNNCIEITEIPYTTTIEAIIEKIIELVKTGKIREIADIRDETALTGLKITIDLKRGTDADILMEKLFKLTPLQDSFSCNFNLLIGGTPQVLGVSEILNEWTAFRIECIRRQIHFDLQKKKEKLHLLVGLSKIILDIDKAIKIVRDTEEDKEVIPNLMIGFFIDEIQAEYIAEIKLRNLNKQYILNRLNETEDLKKEIAELEDTVSNKNKIKKIIISDLESVIKKYKQPRKTMLISDSHVKELTKEQFIEDYAINVFVTKDGYLKKITPQSLRMSSEQRLKDNDYIAFQTACTNKNDILFFTNKNNVYKSRLHDYEDSKASVLGDYIPSKLSMDSDETVVFTVVTLDYSGQIVFFFDNGRCAKVDLNLYATKTNRKKLSGAYCEKFKLITAYHVLEDADFCIFSTNNKVLVLNTAFIPLKGIRTTQGIIAMTQRSKNAVYKVLPLSVTNFSKPSLYKSKTLPASGASLKAEDDPNKQLSLLD